MKQIFQQYVSVMFSRISFAVAVAAGFLATTSIAFAAVEYTPVVGGGGGTSYTLSCGNDKALVGIRGQSGGFVDSVKGVCKQINYDGSWNGDVRITDSAGGSGGTFFSLMCPSGYAVSGIVGNAASYIDRLGIYCGRLGESGRLATPGNSPQFTGGTGGKSFGAFYCPNSKPARLIKGSAGTWVDSISLGCEYVNTLKLSYIEIANNPARVGTTNNYAAISMSLIPADNTSVGFVGFTSSNANVATVDPVPQWSSSREGRAYLRQLSAGCTKITALYKGASVSGYLLVHSAASPSLTLTTPNHMSASANITVTIPSPAPAGGTAIKLTNIDQANVIMPASVVIPQGAVSLGFQITKSKTLSVSSGCLRIKASGNGGEVTHAVQIQ